MNLTASPRVLTLGETTDLSVSVSGGTTPYAYSWSPAPRGCTTPSTLNATMTCKPNETGSFTEVVNVNDSSLPVRSGSANVTLVVNSPSSGSSPLSAGSLFLFAGLMGVVAAAVTAVVIVYYWRRRSRRAPLAPMPESPYIPPPGQPPP